MELVDGAPYIEEAKGLIREYVEWFGRDLSFLAFVWFAAHVGGGFASGASHFAHFIDYGVFCLAFAPLSLAAIAFVYWWGWRPYRRNPG